MSNTNNNHFNQLFSLIPLVLFFVCNKYYDIFVATIVLVISSIIGVLFSYIIYRKVNTVSIMTMIFAIIFGSLTIIFKDESFIKIKVTIINIVFALILIGGIIIKKNFLYLLLKQGISLNQKGWNILNKIWIFFFLGFAIFNEILWRNVSTDTWVNFKVFIFPILCLIFGVMQIPIFKKYIKKQ